MLGAEALIRWNHPNMGLIMPGAFIECFEDAGLIYRLDNYIWEEAAKQLRHGKTLVIIIIYLLIYHKGFLSY